MWVGAGSNLLSIKILEKVVNFKDVTKYTTSA